jgi:hypothetical protein
MASDEGDGFTGARKKQSDEYPASPTVAQATQHRRDSYPGEEPNHCQW